MTRRKRQLLNTAEDLREPRDLDNVTHFEPRRETVGDLLRRAREGRGEELETVATRLRIRPGYLKAIEAGRFQDLPGLTYAVGFVRTYADHVGLDAEDVVRRFRDEVSELKSQTQLVFPVVAAEGKMPRGAILLLSALLAAIAYGGWYYLSEREQSALDLIPELPAKLRALVTSEEPAAPLPADTAPAPEATAAVGSGAAVETAPQAAPTPAAPAATTPATGSAEATAPAVAPEPSPAAIPQINEEIDPVAQSAAEASALAGPGAAPAPATEGAGATVAAPLPETATPTTGQPALPSAPAAPQVGAGQDVATTAAPPPPAAPSFDASGLPTVPAPAATPSTAVTGFAAPATEAPGLPPITDGQAFGAVDGPSRIVLIARLESWVQVTDKDSNALLTRVLRAGDRYYVPDEAGLTLATGNAGGIDIWVDGRKVPAIGPVGVVRRNITLDPQRLADGTALAE